MSGWRDMIFGAIAQRAADGASAAEEASSIVATQAQRKRLLIAGGVGVAIVAALVGLWLWQRSRAKKGAGKTLARKSNPSIRVKRKTRRAKRKAPATEPAAEEAKIPRKPPRKAPRKGARKRPRKPSKKKQAA